jgi:photosystem II PsbW protein
MGAYLNIKFHSTPPGNIITLIKDMEMQLISDSFACLIGLPRMVTRGKLRCSLQEKPSAACGTGSNASMVASLAAAAASWAVTTSATGPAMALVDERLSTEGTGLPFGLSNNLLGWILFGVFGLIWALYFIYASSLEEDEDSGLSL